MRCLPLVGIAAGCIILGALSTAVTLAARHDLNAVNQVAGIVGTAAGVASLIVAVWGFRRRQSPIANAARTPIRRAAVTLSNQYDLLVAAGDGVRYARKPNGELFLLEDTNTWANAGRGVDKRVGTGWYDHLDVVATTGDCRFTGR